MEADESLACSVRLPNGSLFPEPPAWVGRLFARGEANWSTIEGGHDRRILSSGKDLRLTSIRVRDAAELDAATLQRETHRAYLALLRSAEELPGHAPIRLWNFIPRILEALEDLPHRYMVFNAGRYEAYADWYQSLEVFPSTLATASGTGSTGDDLLLHALSATADATPIENPRQIPSYRYSFRYGPRPPAFARATRLRLREEGPTTLLVGGTASICGEDSTHQGNLDAQTVETARNLSALVQEGCRVGGNGYVVPESQEAALACFRTLRVYHPVRSSGRRIEDRVRELFPAAEDVELVLSDLCRPELLIEIEGVAHLVGTPESPPKSSRRATLD